MIDGWSSLLVRKVSYPFIVLSGVVMEFRYFNKLPFYITADAICGKKYLLFLIYFVLQVQ